MTRSVVGQSRNDREGGQSLEGGDSESARTGEVVVVRVCGAFEETEHTQATQLAREPIGREIGQKPHEVAPCQAVDVELRALHGA